MHKKFLKLTKNTELKQALVVRTDLKLSKGKIAAQTAHAAIDAMLKMQKFNDSWVNEWLNQGMKKVVLRTENEKEMLKLFEEVKKEIPASLIIDAGLTEVKPNTKTCIGFGPAPEELIDKFIKNLKLL